MMSTTHATTDIDQPRHRQSTRLPDCCKYRKITLQRQSETKQKDLDCRIVPRHRFEIANAECAADVIAG